MENREVRVSQGKPYTSYVGASKEILKDKGTVELHGCKDWWTPPS